MQQKNENPVQHCDSISSIDERTFDDDRRHFVIGKLERFQII